ncbi:hypothetical protein D770_02215 [Flammeovirgaceae bacterium 311]|nr:hypothetical protein D770_02215 [Flammeovirgaceae bacterium 311]
MDTQLNNKKIISFLQEKAMRFLSLKSRYMAGASVLLLAAGCTEDPVEPHEQQTGFVTGHVINTVGAPLANVDIVVNNSQYYNNNILGQTDTNGKYRLAIEPGSWYVRATIDVQYDNQTYTLDLHPENSNGFAGSEGAVRNFQWKLSGTRPTDFGASGFYGGAIEIVGGGEFADVDGVKLSLKPIAALIDGSTGRDITKNPEGYVLQDVPIGKYEISAWYEPENRPLQIRIRNKDQAYSSKISGSFEPVYPGATENYKITVEVK